MSGLPAMAEWLTARLPFDPYHPAMDIIRKQDANAALASLEAAAASARSGFACMFSSSDEYETALITERRAQGHYAPRRSRWPLVMFVGCALMMAGASLLFG